MNDANRFIFGMLYNRSGGAGLNFWKRVESQRDDAEAWRGPGAWRNEDEHDDRSAWIYVGLDGPPGQTWGDLLPEAERIADAKFSELYPGAVLGRSAG